MTGIVVRTRQQEKSQRRRILMVVAGAAFIAGFLIGFVWGNISAGTGRRPAKTPASTSARGAAPTSAAENGSVTATTRTSATASSTAAPSRLASPPADAPVVAWQPSHTDEKRSDGYHEYLAMGAIAQMAVRDMTKLRGVVAWDIDDGLTGTNVLPDATNTRAFDKELAQSNDASATYFLSLQTSVVADQPGVIVYYQENDETGAVFADYLADALPRSTSSQHLGRLGVRFYSLDGTRNRAPHRVMVEFRQVESRIKEFADRKRQQAIARALVRAVEAFDRQRRP